MSDLYERIQSLCKERNVNITTMCRESGASRGSLTDLKNGRTQTLSSDTLSKIAAYFGVSVDYLLNGRAGNEMTSFANGICVYSSGFMKEIEDFLNSKTPGTYDIVFQGDGVVITVDNDGGATDEQIQGVISMYSNVQANKYKAPANDGGRDILDEVDVAFYGDYKDLTDDDQETVRNMVRLMRERRSRTQE